LGIIVAQLTNISNQQGEHMKYTLLLLVIGIIIIAIPISRSTPDQNGSNPGCTPCHNFQDGMVSITTNGLDIEVTVSGTNSTVAGELVNSSGTVVAVNNGTNSNPFTLTAPGAGNYIVNAGLKSPLVWDSASVSLTVTSVEGNPNNPGQFILYENYPNPFNPSTTIRYSIPESSFTTLIIYDALGNIVSNLVNETKSAGTYEVVFNASELTSGIYFYTLQSGSLKETKKMILTK
jgi:hypothetical protein